MSDLTIGLSLFAFLMLSYWLVRLLGGDAARSVARPYGRPDDDRDVYQRTETTTTERIQPVSDQGIERTTTIAHGHTTVTQVEQPGRIAAEASAAGSRHAPEPRPIEQAAAPKSAWQEPAKPTVQSSLVNVERPHQTPLASSDPLPAATPAPASTVTVSVTRDPERVSPSSLARGAAERDAAARAASAASRAVAGNAAGVAATAAVAAVKQNADSAKPSAAATLPPDYIKPATPDAPRGFADAPTALPPGFARAAADATLAPPSAPEPPRPIIAYEPLPPLPVSTPRPQIEREPPRIELPSVAQTLAPANAVAEQATGAPARAESQAETELPSIASTLPPDYQRPPVPATPKTYVVGPIDLPEAFLRADSRATLAPQRAPEPLKPVVAYEPLPPLPDPKSRPAIERDAPTIVAPNVQHMIAANAPVATAAVIAALASGGAVASGASRAATVEAPSRYALRAKSLPRSEATTPRAPPVAEPSRNEVPPTVTPARTASESVKPAVDPSYLVSLQRRGVRLIGPDVDPVAIDVLVPFVPRPQTPSIWSNALPRRALSDDEILANEILAMSSTQSVKAERIAVRSEPLLVRPDVRQTLAPADSAPAQSRPKPAAQENLIGPLSLTPPSQLSSSVGTAGGFAIAQIRIADEPEKGERPNVGRTLPPGALDEE